jgi:hypothetical protein
VISQREARRLRKRVEELANEIDQRRNAWAADYVGGVHLGTLVLGDDPGAIELFGQIKGARKLRHAVVVTLETDGRRIRFHALPEATR